MKLGGKQFVAGTIGGITGVLGKVTGVMGDAAAKLTMDEDFVRERKHARGTVVQGFEGAARVSVCMCVHECIVCMWYYTLFTGNVGRCHRSCSTTL